MNPTDWESVSGFWMAWMRSHLIFERVNNNPRQRRDIVELNRILRATGSLQVRFVAVLTLWKYKLLGKMPLTLSRLITRAPPPSINHTLVDLSLSISAREGPKKSLVESTPQDNLMASRVAKWKLVNGASLRRPGSEQYPQVVPGEPPGMTILLKSSITSFESYRMANA